LTGCKNVYYDELRAGRVWRELLVDINSMSHSTIPELLAQATVLTTRYSSTRQAAGEAFNVFRILGLQRAEVRTHSAFLAELLNPAGSHGLGAVPLTLLLQQLGITDFQHAAGVRVEVEKHIGFITPDYRRGGRIDLCLYPGDSSAPIFIENKIGAGDQKYQLLRYHSHDPSAHLWYLTLDGADPSEYTTGAEVDKARVRSLSYATDIIPWLETCRKEAAPLPLVRETITQYIHLLRELTGQSTDRQLMNEIKQLLLRNSDNLANAQLLGQAFAELRAEVGQQIRQKLDVSLNALRRELTLPQYAEGTVLALDAYTVHLKYDTDRDGYYWGFPAYNAQGEGGHCKRPVFDAMADWLKTYDSGFRRSDWWIGWVNPPGYARIDWCQPEEVFRLADTGEQQKLAAETALHVRECVLQLRAKFGVGSRASF
jgi:PD-(D/E)XK nuclease superfamily